MLGGAQPSGLEVKSEHTMTGQRIGRHYLGSGVRHRLNLRLCNRRLAAPSTYGM
jgi:hypothetical protein